VFIALVLFGACGSASEGGSSLAADPPCSGEIALTPRTSDGGRYRPGAPEKSTLRQPGLAGTPLVITGYVLFPDCRPVGGAVLDVWQADAAGEYDDDGWRLRGVVRSDEAGRYDIETIVPGSAEGSAPTVRVKASENVGGRIVTTQLFLPDHAANATDRSFRPELVMVIDGATDDGPVHARFDFVIEVG
jgi:protocatechuate 3,4-dioxygenase beta subunit